MSEDAEVAELAARGERAVRHTLGQQVSLREGTVIARRERSLVVRCAASGWDGVASVVVKHNKGDDARGFTDWASLAFLSRLERADGVAPRFYAGTVDERIMVMEDLGGSRSLEEVLGRGEQGAVVGALEDLAVTMARLTTATAGREDEFAGLRAGLPGAAGLGREHETERWLGGRARIAAWAEALDLPLPRGFDAACAAIAAQYARPGAALAFSHGDPAPSNNHVGQGGVRLLDFEYGGYRHALYDITAWELLCPLPRPWLAAMERAFRGALGAASGWAGDERAYRRGWAAMCAYRGLAMLTWLSPAMLAQDRGWTPGWTQRQAAISTALRLQAATTGHAELAAVRELSAVMAERLQARWPELGDGAAPFGPA